MTKVTTSASVKAPKISSLDLRSYLTDDDSRTNEATSLNPLKGSMDDRNKKWYG